MINNYLKTALRSISRKKSFTILNVAGLATGITAALVIFLVIRYERSYDTYHSKADRIYRVITNVSNRSNGEIRDRLSTVPWELPQVMQQDFPGLEKTATISSLGAAQIYVPAPDGASEKKFKQTGIFFTSPELYSIFDYTWLSGNATGLTAPNTVVLSESIARAYFGDVTTAVGKTIQLWSYRVPLQVTGIFKDLPANTDIKVRLGISHATLEKLAPGAFTGAYQWEAADGNTQCFVLLKKKDNLAAVTAGLPAFVKRYYRGSSTRSTELQLQPLANMHLNKQYHNFESGNLSSKELWALGLIGAFLLLVACINFINLATAQSVNRAREIGVRKVLGSNRLQLFSQFMTETAVITVLSMAAAILLTILALPYAGKLMNRELSWQLLLHPAAVTALLAGVVIVSLLAGFYPGMVVSGFNPVAAIKSRGNIRPGGASLRRGLVIFQFVIAQLLVIGTLVVVKQMRYVREQPMGFTRDAVVLINLPSDSTLKLKYDYLKSRMQDIPGVTSASLCVDAPSADWKFAQEFYFDTNPVKQPFMIEAKAADADYYKTFDIHVKAGRLPYPSDTLKELVVNETTVKKLGLSSPEKIIGKTITSTEHKTYPVVGVINDFNSQSLHEAIAPMLIGPEKKAYEFIALRLNPQKMTGTLKKVQQTFTGIYPSYLYDLTFLDERISNYYLADAITAKLFKIFAGLAVFISCLGLYGLISFMVVNRTREVGIRKVLGASINSILFLFSKEFMLLIVVAFLIAAPLGYYFMQGWLSGFYYHTAIGAGIFILAVFLSALVAWITVGYKAFSAALANPVKSLKE